MTQLFWAASSLTFQLSYSPQIGCLRQFLWLLPWTELRILSVPIEQFMEK